jgi:hypothetical protein
MRVAEKLDWIGLMTWCWVETTTLLQKCRFKVFLDYQDGLEQQQCFRFIVVILTTALHRQAKMLNKPILKNDDRHPSHLV